MTFALLSIFILGLVVVSQKKVSAATFAVQLYQGWNLVGVPFVTPLSDVIKQAALEHVVWEYDAPSGQYIQDPNVLRPGKGYWIYSKGRATVLTNGQPVSVIIKLYGGWNLVGVSFNTPLSEAIKQAALEHVVWEYDAPSGKYIQDPNVLRPGKGYWVYSKGERRVVITSEPLSGDRKLYGVKANLSCDNQAPTDKDVVNIVFMNADSLGETRGHFDDHTGWSALALASNLCAYMGNELRSQDAHRFSAITSNNDRWHVRFYHDGPGRRTLAAIHYDECIDLTDRQRCDGLNVPTHRGTRFDEGRDLLKGVFDFEQAGHVVAIWDKVLYVTIK
jgi:hypothetical protein